MSGKAESGGPEQMRKQLADQSFPHLRVDEPGETTGERHRPPDPGFQHGEIKPKTSD